MQNNGLNKANTGQNTATGTTSVNTLVIVGAALVAGYFLLK